MLILVINCGSSSAKYQLFDISRRALLAKGIVERIGPEGASELAHQTSRGLGYSKRFRCPDHYAAIKNIIETLRSENYGVIRRTSEIKGIGHRVVHGQEEFKSSTLITREVSRSLEKFSELAPLHNPPSLAGIKACGDLLRGIPQVAVFDTSFHQTMPPRAFLYGLPYGYYRKYAIRRYGFHGTSHRYVAAEAARVLKRPLRELRLITCHLGNGCSMTAVERGRSIDTTMGLTPLEGLLMGTRTGDLDPAVVLYLLEKERLSIGQMNDLLNKESGLLGVSGVSNDMRDVRTAAAAGNERAKLAIEIFIYRIKKYIGAYFAAMGSLDAVVFTAGIGENNRWMVRRLARELKKVVGRKTRFLVIPTNEELLIAQDTYDIVTKRKV
jgi:acetate kinase